MGYAHISLLLSIVARPRITSLGAMFVLTQPSTRRRGLFPVLPGSATASLWRALHTRTQAPRPVPFLQGPQAARKFSWDCGGRGVVFGKGHWDLGWRGWGWGWGGRWGGCTWAGGSAVRCASADQLQGKAHGVQLRSGELSLCHSPAPAGDSPQGAAWSLRFPGTQLHTQALGGGAFKSHVEPML